MRKLTIFFAALTLSAGLWAETQNVSYLSPVYNTEGDPTSGIKEWQTETVYATVVANNSRSVTWDAGWYVVTGTDVTLSKGAVCNGTVRLILADGAKLTAKGDDFNHTPGIQVSGEGNSLTIYAQSTDAATMGQLIANGGSDAAGIGGGHQQSGSNITINGGEVIATGRHNGAGIGGGDNGSGFNITINGGEVTATGGSVGSSCIGESGSGSGLGSTNIKIATRLQIKAGMNNPPTIVIGNTGGDLTNNLRGMRYAVLHDLLPDTKEAAIAEIDAAIVGVTDETILAIATQAKPNINAATTVEAINSIKTLALAKINALYQILIARQGIQNAEINSMINDAVNIISNATDTERITDAMLDAMTVIGLFQNGKAEGIEQGRAEAFGSMGEPCTNCPAVEVKKGTKTVKLYNPEKVEFKKE